MRNQGALWVSLTLFCILVAIWLATTVATAMNEPSDTSFDCRPGETYTVKECP